MDVGPVGQLWNGRNGRNGRSGKLSHSNAVVDVCTCTIIFI